MVGTAAHLTVYVFPRLPVRQWVLSVPKRLRYNMQTDGAVRNIALRCLPGIEDTFQLSVRSCANASSHSRSR